LDLPDDLQLDGGEEEGAGNEEEETENPFETQELSGIYKNIKKLQLFHQHYVIAIVWDASFMFYISILSLFINFLFTCKIIYT
jgi:hypothetical protein